MIDLLFVSFNRLAYTQHSFRALLANTDWSLVARLVLADDASTDGTREWLEEQARIFTHGASLGLQVPAVEFLPTPFGGPVSAVNAYLPLASPEVDVFAKIDNDTMVPAGWLSELLGLLERHPDVDLLGMAPDVGPPEPCPYPNRGIRYAEFVDGNGLWRHRAFEGRPRPEPERRDSRHGFWRWQMRYPELIKAWAAPDLPVFQLDNLPFEPWLSLGREYVAAGWQRGWPNAPYDETASAYWSWFTDSLVTS
jgi:glycosyltransferase involved in cell wall biosynthesis